MVEFFTEFFTEIFIGAINAVLVTLIFTHRYLPGEPQEHLGKYLGFTFIAAIPFNIIMLYILHSN